MLPFLQFADKMQLGNKKITEKQKHDFIVNKNMIAMKFCPFLPPIAQPDPPQSTFRHLSTTSPHLITSCFLLLPTNGKTSKVGSDDCTNEVLKKQVPDKVILNIFF